MLEDKFIRNQADVIDDEIRLVGEVTQVLFPCAAAEHQDAAIAHLHGTEDVGLHGVADHDGPVGAQAHFLAGCSHHDRAGFSNGKGLDSGGALDHGDDRPTTGTDPLVGGTIWVEVRGDQPCTLRDQSHAAFDHFEGQGAALAYDDKVGIVIDHRVAVAVESCGQSVLADDIGGAAGFLGCEEASGGHRTGKNFFLSCFDTEPVKF